MARPSKKTTKTPAKRPARALGKPIKPTKPPVPLPKPAQAGLPIKTAKPPAWFWLICLLVVGLVVGLVVWLQDDSDLTEPLVSEGQTLLSELQTTNQSLTEALASCNDDFLEAGEVTDLLIRIGDFNTRLSQLQPEAFSVELSDLSGEFLTASRSTLVILEDFNDACQSPADRPA